VTRRNDAIASAPPTVPIAPAHPDAAQDLAHAKSAVARGVNARPKLARDGIDAGVAAVVGSVAVDHASVIGHARMQRHNRHVRIEARNNNNNSNPK